MHPILPAYSDACTQQSSATVESDLTRTSMPKTSSPLQQTVAELC